ncbi:MAG: SPFH domain-containing protein [Candidatus Omnitrophica bacterium]|nr:SPFH domain-containing protein [Candidatus Omnitrophota bacterium]
MWMIVGAVALVLVVLGARIVQQYETSIVFTLGRYSRTLGPGLNFIIPLVEWTRTVDMRILTQEIPKQQVITKDNIPVSINGVVYYKVSDAESAVIKVQEYRYAISQYAQAALRDVIGGMTLDELLAEREQIGQAIQQNVATASKSWGLEVSAIKVQDIDMPEELKKMMSRQASAEREKRATITKAEGDKLAAENLAAAAKTMLSSTGAMQLRTLQTIDGLGPTASNTVIFLLPVEVFEGIKAFAAANKPGAGS